LRAELRIKCDLAERRLAHLDGDSVGCGYGVRFTDKLVQVAVRRSPYDRLIRVSLVLIAFLFGMFGPLIEYPLQASASRLPAKSSPDAPKPLVLHNAYNHSPNVSDPVRSRKPHSGANGAGTYEKLEILQLASRIKTASAAQAGRRSIRLYTAMNHSASSPGRWRC
jgi:hypothetical protein